MKNISKLLAVVIFVAFVAACGRKDVQKTTEASQNELADEINRENPLIKESMGGYSYGFVDVPEDGFVYNGEELNLPYYLDYNYPMTDIDAELGVLLLVDGEVQPFCVKQEDGSVLEEEDTIHYFTLKPNERKDFVVSFQPVTGKAGGTVGITVAMLWSPNYLPSIEEFKGFGNHYKLGGTNVLPLHMNADGMQKSKESLRQCEIMDIPEEILLSIEDVYATDQADMLDAMTCFELVAPDDNILRAENGKLEVTLNLYGGLPVQNKITIFVGNRPVKIEDGDYVLTRKEKGKMCQLKTTIDVSSLESSSVLYAVAAVSGEDYQVEETLAYTKAVMVDIGR